METKPHMKSSHWLFILCSTRCMLWRKHIQHKTLAQWFIMGINLNKWNTQIILLSLTEISHIFKALNEDVGHIRGEHTISHLLLQKNCFPQLYNSTNYYFHIPYLKFSHNAYIHERMLRTEHMVTMFSFLQATYWVK